MPPSCIRPSSAGVGAVFQLFRFNYLLDPERNSKERGQENERTAEPGNGEKELGRLQRS